MEGVDLIPLLKEEKFRSETLEANEINEIGIVFKRI